jgi:hypothetical protein
MAFVAVEGVTRRPLIPLSIFRIRGLAATEITQLIGVGGFATIFFFLTLYVQTVLGYSPTQAGLAYVPATVGIGISVSLAAPAISRAGTRPVIITGALIAGTGLFMLSGIDVDGSYLGDLLPGLAVVALGIGGDRVPEGTLARRARWNMDDLTPVEEGARCRQGGPRRPDRSPGDTLSA